MAQPGSVVYGSWKDGSDIYKDTKGYWILQYSPKLDDTVKKYLKGWRPRPDDAPLCRVKGKWKACKASKRSRKSATRKRGRGAA